MRVLRLYMCRAAHDQPLMVVHPLQGGAEDHGRSYKALHSSDRWPCKVIPYSSPRSSLLTQANQFLLKHHLTSFIALLGVVFVKRVAPPLPSFLLSFERTMLSNALELLSRDFRGNSTKFSSEELSIRNK